MEVESGKPIRVPLNSLEAIDPDTFDWKAYCATYKGRYLPSTPEPNLSSLASS